MEVEVNDVVMPGDIVKEMNSDKKTKIILGPGLRREADTVYICKAGTLKKRAPAIYYVDNYQKRYVPNRREVVIGIVTQKVGDIYKVDIGSKESASLSYLAFEGATKKNRPDVQIGDAVFAKLLVAIKDMEPELVCVDSEGKEKKLGILSSDGMLFNCSLNLVRKLLNPDSMLFKFLGQIQPFEVAVGMNGRIWIKTESVRRTIAIANAIFIAEFTPITKMRQLWNSIEKTLLM